MPSIFCRKKPERPPDAFGNRKAFHQEMDEDFKFFNRAFKILLVLMIAALCFSQSIILFWAIVVLAAILGVLAIVGHEGWLFLCGGTNASLVVRALPE